MKNNKWLIVLSLLVSTVIIYSCKKDYKVVEEPDAPYKLEYGSFPTPPIATDNPLTREGVKLGRMLFYEKALSRDGSMSCASCHNQQTAFSDTNKFSIGVNNMPGGRQAMAVFNMAWNTNEFFWDGRAHLLRHQSLMPIQDNLEMDETLANVVSKLQAKELYRTQFNKAFGTDQVDTLLMSKALEQFMNSIVTHQSKYDDYLAGKVTLSAEEEIGRLLFFVEYNPLLPNASGADCAHCHSGHNFENSSYMNNGLDTDANVTDIGREKVTNNPADKAKFKVTSLRNIELTPPYMHDGRFETLEEVVNHYNRVKQSNTLDPSFGQQVQNNGLHLDQFQRAALVAFLKTLTDKSLATNPAYTDPF